MKGFRAVLFIIAALSVAAYARGSAEDIPGIASLTRRVFDDETTIGHHIGEIEARLDKLEQQKWGK